MGEDNFVIFCFDIDNLFAYNTGDALRASRKEELIIYMEKQVKVIGLAKWLCMPLGMIMYYGTVNSFGHFAACLLCAAATAGFWLLMKREQGRLIGETIAGDIRDAIKEVGNVESFIEIKRAKRGISVIARAAKADVLPVSIFTDTDTEKGAKLTVRFGELIPFEK